jgi:anti-sigma factor RsiW
MKHKDAHLNEDQLLRAVVDETDLPAAVQNHLSTCPVCRVEKGRFEEKLARLGDMAERLAPSPAKKVKLPRRESSKSAGRPWNWRGALAAGLAAAAVVLVVAYGSVLLKTRQEDRIAALSQEMRNDEQLMTEIRGLSENALPVFCLDIFGASDPGLDEEFIEFVVPFTDDDIVSRNKEGALC